MKKIYLSFFTIFTLISSLHGSFQFFPGKQREVSISKEGTVQLLTWNILGLPNVAVAVRPFQERIDHIAKKILSTNADVVILQECFEKELSLGLYDRLKDHYGFIYLDLDSDKPLPSGMALFSKLPVGQFRFSPHPDLVDSDSYSNMGTIDFLLFNEAEQPIAHIAAGHFLGSSNCQWRVGITQDGQSLSYAQIREQEAQIALNILARPNDIPAYLVGDLNVDRRSFEYADSSLNPEVNSTISDAMPSSMLTKATNTGFWKQEKGIAIMFPSLSKKQALSLAYRYKLLYQYQIKRYLSKKPWNQPLSTFDPSYFSSLEKKLYLPTKEERMLWRYFQSVSQYAVNEEKKLWNKNGNNGNAPNVSIGRVIEIKALPIEESLDYVLGANSLAKVEKIELLQGYDDHSREKTLSDHHPLLATIRVEPADTQN